MSNAEVAAAVTNSGSFREKVRKSMRNLSNRLFGTSAPATKSRSRSHSVVQLVDTDLSTSLAQSGNSHVIGHNNAGSLNRSQSRFTSGWAHRLPLPYPDGKEKRSPSPHPNGLARRFSVLGSRSNRSLSPLPGTSDLPIAGGLANTGSAIHRVDPDALGRSVSDRSTTSSTGYLPIGRMGPLRRQSTHLVPPVVGNFELQPQHSRNVLSTSNSVERLDSINKKLSTDGSDLSLADSPRSRARAPSNASSAAGIATGNGLQNKLAKLLSRGAGEKASGPAQLSVNEQAIYRHDDEAGNLQHKVLRTKSEAHTDAVLRSHASGNSIASNFASYTRPDSPLVEESKQFTTLTQGNHDSQPPNVHEQLPAADNDFDKADWEGDLSDDDDDYGEPVKSVYSRPDPDGTLGLGPRDLDELDRGTWVMNGRGWQHRETTEPAGTLLSSVIPRDANMETNGDLQLDIGAIMPDPGFSPSDVPATIAETDAEFDGTLSPRAVTSSYPLATVESRPTIGKFSPTSPRQAFRSEQGRTARLSPGAKTRAITEQRWTDRPWLSSSNEMFDDAEEDDEDDGLEIDVGLKRGRRSSKPLTPAMGRRPSLPTVD